MLFRSLTVAGWQGLTTYPHFLWDLNLAREAAAIYPRNMPNLRGLIEGWSAASASMHSLEVIVLLLSVALVAWAARTCRFSAGANTSASSFAFVLIVSFLVGYHSSGFDAAFLLLPALLAAERVLGSVGGITTPERITLICIGTLYFAPLYLWLLMPLAHLNLLALVLLLWAWATAAEVRQAPGALVT